MKPNLQREIDAWTEAEYPTEVVPAPTWSTTADQMLIVYLDDTKRAIRRVSRYDSKTDTFVGHH